MKTCKVIVNFELEDLQTIKSKLNQENVLYFTNDLMILDKGKELGLHIEMLATYYGFFTPEDDAINDISISRLNNLENYLNDSTLESKSIVKGLSYVNLLNLLNLEKIRRILELKENVVFLFKNYSFYFPAIIQIAKSMNIKTEENILTISNDEIASYEISDRYDRLNSLRNRLKVRTKELEKDSFFTRLSEIKLKEKNYDAGFFLINNDTDFYLKPIYPILEKLSNSKQEFVSFTFEERTVDQMSEQKFKTINLTKYFSEAFFPYSRSLKDQLIHVFRKQEESRFILLKKIYSSHLEQHELIQKFVSELKGKSKYFKKFRVFGKLLVLVIAIFDLISIYIKNKIILTKWWFLRFYIRHLERYPHIQKIVRKPKIKSLLTRDLADLEEIPFLKIHSYSIPGIEIKRILKFTDRALSNNTEDIVIKNYLNCFNDNYIVGKALQLLVTHALVQVVFNKMKFRSLLVAADSAPFNNVACNVADYRKIPTYSIPQVYIKFQKIGTVLPNASKIFVSGEHVKKEFVRLGMDKEKIIITGNPRYDYIKKNTPEGNAKTSKKIIVVAMSRWHEKDPQWMTQLIQFCNKNSLDILIKVHPMYKFYTNNEFSEELIEKIKQNCSGLKFVISYDMDLKEILPKTSVLITEYSIVAVEAAFNEIPVIVTNINRNKDDEYSKGYQKEGIAIHTSTITELCNSITKILDDKETGLKLKEAIKQFNYNYNYLHDGKATERILNTLERDK